MPARVHGIHVELRIQVRQELSIRLCIEAGSVREVHRRKPLAARLAMKDGEVPEAFTLNALHGYWGETLLKMRATMPSVVAGMRRLSASAMRASLVIKTRGELYSIARTIRAPTTSGVVPS